MKSRVVVSTSVTSDVCARIEDAARREHLSVSSYTRKALEERLASRGMETKTARATHGAHGAEVNSEDAE